MKNYYAFEPGEKEFFALKLSAQSSKAYKIAFGK